MRSCIGKFDVKRDDMSRLTGTYHVVFLITINDPSDWIPDPAKLVASVFGLCVSRETVVKSVVHRDPGPWCHVRPYPRLAVGRRLRYKRENDLKNLHT